MPCVVFLANVTTAALLASAGWLTVPLDYSRTATINTQPLRAAFLFKLFVYRHRLSLPCFQFCSTPRTEIKLVTYFDAAFLAAMHITIRRSRIVDGFQTAAARGCAVCSAFIPSPFLAFCVVCDFFTDAVLFAACRAHHIIFARFRINVCRFAAPTAFALLSVHL